MREGDLELAIAAARDAAAVLRAAFGAAGAVRYKSRDQPVTQADHDADHALRNLLLGERPGYGWISEESGRIAAEGDLPSWVVDPLDGTANFVAGQPGFAVSVALVERGTPVVGVVYNALAEVAFHAVAGCGSFRDGQRIRAARQRHERPRFVGSVRDVRRSAPGALAAWEVSTIGSTTLKTVAVASGDADVYVSLGRKEVWDIAAGALIAAEAGARMLGLDGKDLLPDLPMTPVDGVAVVAPSILEPESVVGALTRAIVGSMEEGEG